MDTKKKKELRFACLYFLSLKKNNKPPEMLEFVYLRGKSLFSCSLELMLTLICGHTYIFPFLKKRLQTTSLKRLQRNDSGLRCFGKSPCVSP